MTKQTILKELTDCLLKYHSASTIGIATKDIVRFLLGEKITADNGDDLSFSDSQIMKIYNGERSLSSESLSKLEASTDWSLQRLSSFCPTINNESKTLLIQDVQDIYKKHFPDSSTNNLDFNIMIRYLIIYHFFDTDETGYLFSTFPFNKKGLQTCRTYISWPEKEDELYHLLINNQLVFLTGQPASGKRQLVKYCLQTQCQYPDLFWLTIQADSSLAQQINNIEFRCGETEYNEVLEILKLKTSSSLLVIYLPLIKDEDYSFIDNYLTDMKITILIITNTILIPDQYVSINIDHRPLKYLKQLYTSFDPVASLSDNEFERLCNVVSFNPLVIELLAKALSNQKCPSKDDSSKLIKTNDFFHDLFDSSSWYIDEHNLPKIHSLYHDNGKKPALKINHFIEKILNHYDKEFLITTGSELSIYAKNEISISDLEKYISTPDISKAIKIGLLQYTGTTKSTVKMPSIIADIIWQKYPINYKDYKERIFRYLYEISLGQTRTISYHSLYDHILTMIYRFHFQITKMKSRNNKTSKDSFIEWNHILCELILYFIKLGNTHAAEKILSRLYIYRSKTGNNEYTAHSLQSLERKIFELHIEFAENISPLETLNKVMQVAQELPMEKIQRNSEKYCSEYFSLFEKFYDFITSIIDTLLLKQFMMFTESFSDSFQNYIFYTTKTLENFIINYPAKEGNDIYYYYKILYHYQITYYYHTKNTINSDYLLRRISEDSPLKFKAKLWTLYYKLLKEVMLSQLGYLSLDPELLDSIICDYRLLLKEFHHKVTSFNTSTLFYYLTILIDLLLPPNYLYTFKLIRSILEEAYNSITNQILLSEEDKSKLLKLLKQAEFYSKLKQDKYYSKIILPAINRIKK